MYISHQIKTLLAVRQKLHQVILKDLSAPDRDHLKAQVDALLASLDENVAPADFSRYKIQLPLLYYPYIVASKNPASWLEQFLYRHFSRFYSVTEIDAIIEKCYNINIIV